jgi:hypothetical protein
VGLLKKFGLNAAKCKSISFNKKRKSIGFDYRFRGQKLEHVEKIKDLGVILNTRMPFLSHVETVISKSAKMLGFIKCISREFNDHYTDKALFVSLVRQNLECLVPLAWLVSGPPIRSAKRRELSVSKIILLGSLFASFAGQSIHWQHMTLD